MEVIINEIDPTDAGGQVKGAVTRASGAPGAGICQDSGNLSGTYVMQYWDSVNLNVIPAAGHVWNGWSSANGLTCPCTTAANVDSSGSCTFGASGTGPADFATVARACKANFAVPPGAFAFDPIAYTGDDTPTLYWGLSTGVDV